MGSKVRWILEHCYGYLCTHNANLCGFSAQLAGASSLLPGLPALSGDYQARHLEFVCTILTQTLEQWILALWADDTCSKVGIQNLFNQDIHSYSLFVSCLRVSCACYEYSNLSSARYSRNCSSKSPFGFSLYRLPYMTFATA